MGAVFEPIGTVHNDVQEPTDAGWGEVTSRIVLDAVLAPGLAGLEGFSHVIVVTHLHGAAFEPARHLVRRPQGRADLPAVGIFAQRAKDRPNPIGVTAARLLGAEGGTLTVQGLDAINGTPVLDVKPYFPQYDARDATVPPWVGTLMGSYF